MSTISVKIDGSDVPVDDLKYMPGYVPSEGDHVAIVKVGHDWWVVGSPDPAIPTVGGGVGATGPRGATGPAGPTGPTGPPISPFVWNQSSPAATWDIVHGMGTFPAVVVLDSFGDAVEGDLVYVDNNELTIGFVAAQGGTAYLI